MQLQMEPFKMKALVMSGGGSKGAFTQGVLTVLAENGEDYSFVSGVSVGALEAGMVSQFPLGAFGEAVEVLDKIWLGLKGNESIYKRWIWGKLAGLVSKDAFYNSSPLQKIIKTNVKDEKAAESGREIRIGCCAYGAGNYWEATQFTPDLWKWVCASSGLEPYLLGKWINDDLWMDGGYRCVTPLQSAIDAGCTTMDVVLTGPPITSTVDPHDNWSGTKRNAVTVGFRCVDLMSSEIFLRDVKRALLYNDLIDIGHPNAKGKKKLTIRVFMPSHSLGSGLDFDPKLIRERRKYGIDKAKEILMKIEEI